MPRLVQRTLPLGSRRNNAPREEQLIDRTSLAATYSAILLDEMEAFVKTVSLYLV